MKKEKINIKELINRFIPTVKKIIEYIKKVEFKSKMKLIGEIIVIILILCLLKLPFSIVRDLIINAFFSVKISSEFLMDAIYLLFGIPYFLLAIYLFIKTIVIRYENIEVKEDVLSLKEQDNKVEEVVLPNVAVKEIKEDISLQNDEVNNSDVVNNEVVINKEEQENSVKD